MIRASKTTPVPTRDVPQDSLNWLMGLALVAQLVAFAIVLLVAGSMLRRHCFRMLGQSFTIDVRASANQPVVERGAYAVVRHPGYAAGIVMLVAVGLALGSYIGLFTLTATALFVYIRRMAFEESALEAALGEKYRIYAARRKRLIPYVY